MLSSRKATLLFKKYMKKPKIEIRPPKMSDAESLTEMINSLVEERAMILVQEKLTIKDILLFFISLVINSISASLS